MERGIFPDDDTDRYISAPPDQRYNELSGHGYARKVD